MKKNKDSSDSFGSSLLVVICICIVIAVVSVTIFNIAQNAMSRVKRNQKSQAALCLAESGIADMIARLETNYVRWQNATNFGTLGTDNWTGTYYVVSTTLTNNGHIIITSTGTVSEISRTTVMELLGTMMDYNRSLFSLDGVMLGGTIIAFSTAAFDINGNVHCNGNITGDSGSENGNINGTVSAVGTIGNLGGTKIPGAPSKEIPKFNFESYRTLAISNGLYYGNGIFLANVDLKPSNGVMYVNGNVTIGGNSSLVGTLVANGSVIINNSFTQSQPVDHDLWPSILSTGAININNNEDYNGVMYADTGIVIDNNVTIHGGVITPGSISVRNSLGLTKPLGYPPFDPLKPAWVPEVIVGGWLK